MSAGIFTSYSLGLDPSLEGQPPSIERMTDHRVEVEGCMSVVKATWQEPPPWTAEPVKDILTESPAAAVLDRPSVE